MKLALISILLTQFVFANTWRLQEPKLDSEKKGKYFNSLNLKYKRKIKVTVTYKEELPSGTQDVIKEVLDQFYADANITFNKVTFHYQDDELSFLIKPKTLEGKKNLIKYLPAGIRFYYSRVLTYDFRVSSEKRFVRVKGVFKSMEEIVKNIKQASSAFFLTDIDEYDPNFLINQLRYLDNEIREMKEKLKKRGIRF